MEIRTFKTLQELGKVQLVRDSEDSFRVLQNKFDPDTGEPIVQEVAKLTKSGLEHAIGQHQKVLEETPLEIEGIQYMLSELDKLPVPELVV